MKIETIEIAGFASAFKALRLPFGLEPRTSCDVRIATYKKGEEILEFGEPSEVNEVWSHSRVTINDKDLARMQDLIVSGDEHAKVLRGIIAYAEITAPVFWWCENETYRAGHERLCSESTMHIDCKGLTGEELQKAKAEIPMGKELTKIDFFSYQCLRNIVKQRHNHRLPEWHQFIDWIKTLPFAEELIFIGLNEQ